MSKSETNLSYATHNSHLTGEGLRYEELHGEEHLVAPVVMCQEMILPSPQYGPKLMTFEALAESVPAWNGSEVTLDHPGSGGEEGESAYTPDKFSRHNIGHIFGVEAIKTPKMRGIVGEAWMHPGRAESSASKLDLPNPVEELDDKGEDMDVSIGYFFSPVWEEGYYGDQKYTVRVSEIRPDHLAILPHKMGNCSLSDGCGIRISGESKAEEGTMLASFLENRIAKMDTPREEVVKELASTAELTRSEIYKTLNGSVQCPPVERLEAYSEVLNVSLATLKNRARQDGCGYRMEVLESAQKSETAQTIAEEMDGERPVEVLNQVAVESDRPRHEVDLALMGQEEMEDDILEATTKVLGEDIQSNREDEDMKIAFEEAVTSVTASDIDSYTDEEWNGSEAMSNAPNPSEDEDAGEVLDAMCMVHPTEEDRRNSKSNWKLPFRTGDSAPANTRALVAIRAALDGARGGVEGLSEDTRDAVRGRVNSMLEDAPDDLFGSEEDAGLKPDKVLEEARTPFYDEVEEESGFTGKETSIHYWADVLGWESVGEFEDLSQDQKEKVRGSTMLGTCSAGSWNNLVTTPVVNPETGKLSREALISVVEGETIPDEVPEKTSETAKRKAKRLLSEEFGYDLEEDKSLLSQVLDYFRGNEDAKGEENISETEDNVEIELPEEDIINMDEEELKDLRDDIDELLGDNEEEPGDNPEGSEKGEEAQPGDEDNTSESDGSEVEIPDEFEEKLEGLQNRVDEYEEVVEKVKEEEEKEIDTLKTQIASESSMEKDDLPDDAEALSKLRDELVPKGGFSGGYAPESNEDNPGEDIPIGLEEAEEMSG